MSAPRKAQGLIWSHRDDGNPEGPTYQPRMRIGLL